MDLAKTRRFISANGGRGTCAALVVVGASLVCSHAARASLPVRNPELISHSSANFGDVRRVTGASDAGDRVAYVSTASEDYANSSLLLSATVASRSTSGWTSASGDPVVPQLAGGGQRIDQPLAVSDDFSRLLIFSHADLAPEDVDDGGVDLYLVDVGSGALTLVTGRPCVADSAVGAVVQLVGASRDLSHIYFISSGAALLPGAPISAMYEWHDGQLRLVTIGGAGVGTAAVAYSRSGFDVASLSPAARIAHGGPHVVSDDGSTVFVKANGTLFASEDGTAVPVGASQRAGGAAPTDETFIGASRDGDIAYFSSDDQLTDAATPGGGLYRYTRSTGALVLVTPDAGAASLGMTDAGISDDASHVYFVAGAALTPGAQPGAGNIYTYSDGHTRLVASVPAGATVQRVSRSGRFAIIKTTGSIAGAPSNGKVALYEYDDVTGLVSCVSCRADGAPSQGDATLNDQGPSGIGSFPELSAPRNITDDGHVFFASDDRLVPDDLSTAWDVYEYGNGALSLLSTGRGVYDSYVADNGDDGRDAFFVTRSALVPEADPSGYASLYDARVGGGFAPSVGPGSAPCAVDCQTVTPPPGLASSATSALQDPGNVDEEPKPDERPAAISVTSARTTSGTTRGLTVKVSGGGTIRLLGASVGTSRRLVTQAGSYALTASLTAKARSTLKRKRTLKVTVSVVFTSSDGTSVTKRVPLTFKEPAKAGSQRHGRTSTKGDR